MKRNPTKSMVIPMYRRGSVVAQEREQISTLHQFEQDEVGIGVQTDAEQTQDVVMLEVAHQQGFLQEFALLLLRGSFAQRLQIQRHLGYLISCSKRIECV